MASHLNSTTTLILSQAFAPSTIATYRRAANVYTEFCTLYHVSSPYFPVSIHNTMSFISYMFIIKYAPATISTYVGAIAAINRLCGGSDLFSCYWIKKMLAGIKRHSNSFDQRLPITSDILYRLLDSLPHITSLVYTQALLRAMYLLAFHAFLRIGEFTSRDDASGGSGLRLQDITLMPPNNPTCCAISIQRSKNSTNPQTIHIHQQQANICPVRALQNYLMFRGSRQGLLFLLPCHKPVTREKFCSHLHRSITWAGLDPKRYKSHSFRIGAATSAAMNGVNEATIQTLGRWKSDAFKKYIRMSNLHS
jgi:hypothetical protein